MPGLDELLDLVHEAGGIATLAGYLDLEPQMLEAALSAPEGAWTDRVSQMVAENTSKLIQMPSQGGFFWRLTRRRVVKDWRLMARWSDSHARSSEPDTLERLSDSPLDALFTPRPDRQPRTASGTVYYPWPVTLRILEKHYSLNPDEPWSTEAEERFAEDMRSASAGTAAPELRRFHGWLTDPEIVDAYEREIEPGDEHMYRRLMQIVESDGQS
jgi:hypothetical protein